jgi:hypothetical protein
MLQYTRRRLRVPRPRVEMDRLRPALDKLGLGAYDWPTTPFEAISSKAATNPSTTPPPTIAPRDSLAPLFTPHFVVENNQLIALGDAAVKRHVATSISNFLLYRGIAVSPNVARMLQCCFHNGAAMQYFAEQLGLLDLANFDTRDFTTEAHLQPLLAQLREPPVGPSRTDLAGTSFDFWPTPATPSVWGPRMSHFLGAIRLHLGDDACRVALKALYGFDPQDAAVHNIPHRAAAFLTEVVATSSAPRVADSLAAAQGLQVQYKVRQLPAAPAANTAAAERGGTFAGGSSAAASGAHSGVSAAGTSASGSPSDPINNDDSALTSNQAPSTAATAGDSALELARRATLSGSVAHPLAAALPPGEALKSLAAGPGMVDLLSKFHKRTSERYGDAVVASNDGWLPPAETVAPAFTRHVRFASAETGDAFFSDLTGVPEPRQGAYVSSIQPAGPKADDDFYSQFKDKNGIAVDTFGMSSGDFVRSFRPESGGARRVFEVTMVTTPPSGGPGVVAAKSLAPRYTSARSAVASAYLEGVMLDLLRVADPAGAGATNADASSSSESR